MTMDMGLRLHLGLDLSLGLGLCLLYSLDSLPTLGTTFRTHCNTDWVSHEFHKAKGGACPNGPLTMSLSYNR